MSELEEFEADLADELRQWELRIVLGAVREFRRLVQNQADEYGAVLRSTSAAGRVDEAVEARGAKRALDRLNMKMAALKRAVEEDLT